MQSRPHSYRKKTDIMIIDKVQLEAILDTEIHTINFFEKGQIGDIYKICTADECFILKTSKSSSMLQTEANMLIDINKYKIPVPEIFDVSARYLLMEFIEEGPVSTEVKELQAAKSLSDLHSVTNESRMYGYYYDTSIASFGQKNEQTQFNWGLFLGQMRIMPMAQICYERGQLSKMTVNKLEVLCRDIYKRIDMNSITPSLLHGDLWSGNILFNNDHATLIDPAIYFGDREMELAFILMFNTFGDTFFNSYSEVHALSDDFYETKVPLYQIYPYLVHIALYGSSYISGLEEQLKRLKV
jgi:fructosamine-3-kinase